MLIILQSTSSSSSSSSSHEAIIAEINPELGVDVMSTLIDDVLQSNNRQPSVPAVVLEAIQDVIQAEPIDINGQGNDEETQEVKMELDDDEEEDKQAKENSSKPAKDDDSSVANGHVTPKPAEVAVTRKSAEKEKPNGALLKERSIYEKTKPTKVDSDKKNEAALRKKEDSTSAFSRQVSHPSQNVMVYR